MTAPDMNPVSPRLATVRYIVRLTWLVVLGAAATAAAWWFERYPWLVAIACLALLLWQIWLVPRQVANLGWREDEDELLITKGKLWHTFTVVPYGRIQFVDVTAGPIERYFGLKSVELHTASASSDSSIQGLPADAADALRDRLAIKARERMSGL